MGMYTGLRAKVVVKPQYRRAIGLLHEDDDLLKAWEAPAKILPEWAKTWLNYGRSCFIPFGGLAYMPDDFDKRNVDKEDGRSSYDEVTGVWEFACSLKNYESEIEYFVPNVLFNLAESVEYCESLYEQNEEVTTWIFGGNK